jgi:hypothetical protein
MSTGNSTPSSRRRGSTGADATSRPRGSYRRQLTAIPAGAGVEARRAAAVILEVLAGARTAAGAASALGIHLQRYYILEERAVQGLVAACEPRPRGRSKSTDRRLGELERELATARRDLARQQALARTAQRALGLTAPPPPSKAKAGAPAPKRRQRKPVKRGLRAARLFPALRGPRRQEPTGGYGVDSLPDGGRARRCEPWLAESR